MSLRTQLESLSMTVLGDHFSENLTWTTATGNVQVRAVKRTGIPDSLHPKPTAIYLMVEPSEMPANAAKKDTVTIDSQAYTVVEIQRRESSFTGVTLEIKKTLPTPP